MSQKEGEAPPPPAPPLPAPPPPASPTPPPSWSFVVPQKETSLLQNPCGAGQLYKLPPRGGSFEVYFALRNSRQAGEYRGVTVILCPQVFFFFLVSLGKNSHIWMLFPVDFTCPWLPFSLVSLGFDWSLPTFYYLFYYLFI